MFPLGGWGVASAAVLLLALGIATAVELGTDSPVLSDTSHAASDLIASDSMVVTDDPTLAQFHELEVFDQVGLAPGELIADWSR